MHEGRPMAGTWFGEPIPEMFSMVDFSDSTCGMGVSYLYLDREGLHGFNPPQQRTHRLCSL